jgi:hypothetical protein
MEYSYIPPSPIAVKPIENYHVYVKFDSSEEKVFNVEPYIKGRFYGELRNKGYFRTVHITEDGFCLEWPNGQDIAPEDLYYDSVPADEYNAQNPQDKNLTE